MALALRILAVAILVAFSAPARAADYKAGEVERAASSPSAAARNRGDPQIRIVVWYPVRGQEVAADTGPVFRMGEPVAGGAPFADDRRRPVILLSHGFGGIGRQLAWLGAPLAREGYVVVAVDHPGTNGRDGVTAEGAYAPWERAGDLKAALELVLADPVLGPHIDAKRIGVAGFSMGGFTAALQSGARPDFDRFIRFCNGPERDAICEPQLEFKTDFNQQAAVLAQPNMRDLAARRGGDFRDPRIKAALLIAPALGQALDPASLTQVAVPTAVVLGDADRVVPPATNGVLMAHAIPGATLKALAGAGHYAFLAECGPLGATEAAAYCTDAPGISRSAIHAATLAEAVAFFDKHLAGKR